MVTGGGTQIPTPFSSPAVWHSFCKRMQQRLGAPHTQTLPTPCLEQDGCKKLVKGDI